MQTDPKVIETTDFDGEEIWHVKTSEIYLRCSFRNKVQAQNFARLLKKGDVTTAAPDLYDICIKSHRWLSKIAAIMYDTHEKAIIDKTVSKIHEAIVRADGHKYDITDKTRLSRICAVIKKTLNKAYNYCFVR